MRELFLLCVAASVCAGQDAKALFDKHCAGCHQPAAQARAPLPAALALLSKERIVATLEQGSMMAQGAALTSAERSALAGYLAGAAKVEERAEGGDYPAATFSISPGEAGLTRMGGALGRTRVPPAASAGARARVLAARHLRRRGGGGCVSRPV